MANATSSQPVSSPPQDDYLPHGHLPHPYYPVEAEVVGYLANSYSVPFLLTTFAGICAVLFLLTGVTAKTINPKLSKNDVLTVMWFVLSTCHPMGVFDIHGHNFVQAMDSCTDLLPLQLARYTSSSRATTRTIIGP